MRVFKVNQGRLLLRLEQGEEAMEKIRGLAEEHRINAGVLRGLGAAASAELAYYHRPEKRYQTYPVTEEAEVVSLVGNLARGEDGKPLPHVHAVLSRRDGSTIAGHVMRLVVGATLEIDLEILPGALHRKLDPGVGLPLQDSYTP